MNRARGPDASEQAPNIDGTFPFRQTRFTAASVACPLPSTMSFALPSFDESPGWGGPVEQEDDVVTAAIKKEKIIKCVRYSLDLFSSY